MCLNWALATLLDEIRVWVTNYIVDRIRVKLWVPRCNFGHWIIILTVPKSKSVEATHAVAKRIWVDSSKWVKSYWFIWQTSEIELTMTAYLISITPRRLKSRVSILISLQARNQISTANGFQESIKQLIYCSNEIYLKRLEAIGKTSITFVVDQLHRRNMWWRYCNS